MGQLAGRFSYVDAAHFPAFTVFATNYPAYKLLHAGDLDRHIFVGLFVMLTHTRIGLWAGLECVFPIFGPLTSSISPSRRASVQDSFALSFTECRWLEKVVARHALRCGRVFD